MSSAKEHQPQRAVIVSFDGNIGSGKSTTGIEYEQYIKARMRKASDAAEVTDTAEATPVFPTIKSFKDEICFLDEPVDEWNKVCDKDGVNILTNLYKDIRANAFKFQMMAYISRLALLRNAIKNPKVKLIITERSVETDRNVFAKMLYDVGDISHEEFQIYTMWFDEFLTDVQLSGIVYIHASPSVCIDRIKQRSRPGEIIQSEYIQRCHEYHENWIHTKKCPLLELPANEDVIGTPRLLSERMEKITEFINMLLDTSTTASA
jgi:deoxyadenosine/deoxycytidine kinase